jgi:hypothetical protein
MFTSPYPEIHAVTLAHAGETDTGIELHFGGYPALLGHGIEIGIHTGDQYCTGDGNENDTIYNHIVVLHSGLFCHNEQD